MAFTSKQTYSYDKSTDAPRPPLPSISYSGVDTRRTSPMLPKGEIYMTVRAYSSESPMSAYNAIRAANMTSRSFDPEYNLSVPFVPEPPLNMSPIDYYQKHLVRNYEYEFNKNMIRLGRFDLIMIDDEYLPYADYNPSIGQWYYYGVPVSERAYWAKISKNPKAIRVAMYNPDKINRTLMNAYNDNAYIFLAMHKHMIEFGSLQSNPRSTEIYRQYPKCITWDAIQANPELGDLVVSDVDKVSWKPRA